MGVLLIEPRRWHDVQLALGVDEISQPLVRGLAEAFWEHQRDEGEPVFSEFVELLPSAEMKALALELADEIETLEDVEVALHGALKYLQELRHKDEEQKIVVAAQRAGGESNESQVQLLRELQERRRQPDLRRVGF
jgi:hypothetical protein